MIEISVRDMPALELALLRHGVHRRTAGRERCERCDRTPLIGERIYFYEHGILCELCRALRGEAPLRSQFVHGPEFGHTIRLSDRRAA